MAQIVKTGKIFRLDGVDKSCESYPHLFHAGFLLSASLNLANRHILSRGKFDFYLKKRLTFLIE
jgi:hypothetical protein